MSCKVMYTCDHCGKEVSPYLGKQWRVTLFTVGPNMDDVHACSKEHLGIALAKAFGIGINGEADELLNRKQQELTKLADANNRLIVERNDMYARLAELEARAPANEVTNAERAQYETTIELQRKRIEELSAPITVDGKTPGEVLILAQHGCRPSQVSREMLESAERDALAVIRAFGQPSQTTQDTVDALRRVRERIDSDPYPDVRSLRHIDEELAKLEAKPAQCPPDTSTESGLPDPVIGAITLPTKPTKPLREVINDPR